MTDDRNQGPISPPARRKLPHERPALTHKFSVGGHEGYIIVGFYPNNGDLGEVFMVMSKEGSTLSGIVDQFSIAISRELQHGVPIEQIARTYGGARYEPFGFTRNPDVPWASSITDYLCRWLVWRFRRHAFDEIFGLPGSEQAAMMATMLPATDALALPADAVAAAPKTIALPVPESPPGFAAEVAADRRIGFAMTALPASPMTGQVVTAPRRFQGDGPPCGDCGTLMIRRGACYSCPECFTTTGCG